VLFRSPDGSLLLRYLGTSRFTDTDEPCPELTVGRPPMVFGRYMPGTATGIDTIAVLLGFEWTGDRNDLHAYSKDLVFGIAQDRLYLGDTGSDTILVIGFRGDTIATLPVPFEPAPVPADAKVTPFRDATVSDGGGTWTERMTFNYPDNYPRFARLVAAPGERVWVMAYPPLKEPAYRQELVHPLGTHRLDAGARWSVLDPDGLSIAEVRTPPRFFLLEVGDDYVLGLRVRAATNGRSMEEEARTILRAAVDEEDSKRGLGTRVHALFRPFGGVKLEIPPREPMRDPPRFG